MSPAKRATADQSQRRLTKASDSASQAVRQATEVLEEQLSAGVAGSRKVAAGLAQNRQIDERAFDEVLERLRSSAHDIIRLAADRVPDLKADDVQNLAERFASDAHAMFDSVIDLVAATPGLVNQLSVALNERTEGKPTSTKRTARSEK